MLSNKQAFLVLADAKHFENYDKDLKLFDEIFMRLVETEWLEKLNREQAPPAQ